MARCVICGTKESFERTTYNQELGGQVCSRCQTIGHAGGNAAAADADPLSANHPNILMVGVLANYAVSVTETTALTSVYNSPHNDSAPENIWGVGLSARHQTLPHTNIVIVFTRNVNALVTEFRVYGIGRHTGSAGNHNYKILRWTGGFFRVTRL
ncbi:MAG TPA: hypothetical protein VM553_23070 [Dongiaceae bacterium]|jgi:hypothetical protein|nr:hypothetical protein [Dongiaceae bacterium]